MTQADLLYQLQEVDLKLRKCQTRLSEIDAQLADQAALLAAQAQVDDAQAALTPLKAQARGLEHDIQTTLDKAKESEAALYGGHIRSPKELQDLEQETAALKRHQGELEDKLFDVMMAIEAGEAALSEAQTELRRVTEAEADDHRDLIAERAALQLRTAELQDERGAAAAQIEPANLKLYENLKPRKGHTPVAIMRGNSCTVCGVEQTLANERAANLGHKVVLCESCGRILVFRS